MSPEDERHGTARGYSAHRREGSEPCAACRKGAADYERRRFYDAHLGRNRLIDVTGSRRRLLALQAIGWPKSILAAELGYGHRYALDPLVYDAEWITRSRAQKIADLYERLSSTPGPSNITRVRAQKAGYAPPNAWLDIDDPDEQPDPGYRRRNYRSDELAAEWDFLRRAGVSIHTAAQQLGVSVSAIEKALERVGKDVA